MTDASPDNDVWLRDLIHGSPVLADADVRRHWQQLIPWLPTSARYALAAILLDIEHAVACD